MQELLLGRWGPQIVAYSQQHPWRVFAAILVATLLVLDLLFRKKRSSPGDGGDISGFDFGDGGGGAD
jgi:hypothetical protein